jgi:RNA polymerase sigma-B factor
VDVGFANTWVEQTDFRQRRQLELLRAVHDRADSAARQRLIEENLPLVRLVARRYARRGEPYDDLMQVGAIGLIKAIDRFDPDRGFGLEAYAIPMIVGEIKRHFRDRGWAVHVPRRLKELNLKLTSLVDQLSSSLGRSPTIAELAKAASVEPEEVIEALEAGQAYTALSLSVPVGDDPDTVLEHTIADPEAVFAAADDRDFIARGLSVLDKRERAIVELRFFSGLSQSQIAQELGISQMHVSRLIRRALEKIRLELSVE